MDNMNESLANQITYDIDESLANQITYEMHQFSKLGKNLKASLYSNNNYYCKLKYLTDKFAIYVCKSENPTLYSLYKNNNEFDFDKNIFVVKNSDYEKIKKYIKHIIVKRKNQQLQQRQQQKNQKLQQRQQKIQQLQQRQQQKIQKLQQRQQQKIQKLQQKQQQKYMNKMKKLKF
jgi:hypothetical protein